MTIDLPAHVSGAGALDRLVNIARDCASAATSENTLKAYARIGRISRAGAGCAVLPPAP